MTATLLIALLFAGDAAEIGSHVRSSSPAIASLCHEAGQQSASFRALVAELNQSDVIVYIEPSSRLRDGLAGALNHDVVVRGGIRYVRVLVSPFAMPARTIGLIAHELQHVVEIARDPDATDTQSVQRVFQRIGFSCPGRAYETVQAQTVERMVSAEIRTARASQPKAAAPLVSGTRTARAQ